jgi:hypothetical protein
MDRRTGVKPVLPGEMREGLVCVGHAMHVVALRHRGTLALVGGDDLLGELLERRPPLLLADRLQ